MTGSSEKNITLAKLAKVLNLDKSSVSLALRNSPRTSRETQHRVRETALRYGYKPNVAAQRLRSKSPLIIGLVLPSSFSALRCDVVVSAIQTLAQLMAMRGIGFNLLSDDVFLKNEAAFFPLFLDGLFVWGEVPFEAVFAIQRLNRPFLVMDPNQSGYVNYKGLAVRIDNREGGAMMARHLLERGSKRLLFVLVHPGHLGHQDRWEGARVHWLSRMPAQSVSQCLIEELSDEHLKTFAERPDGAIFCSNDFGAIKIWHRLMRLGIQTPRAVRLAGFDGDEYGRLFQLTTMLFDSAALARTALDRLFAAMQEPQKILLTSPIPVTLQTGQTA